jgi:hypothetical protein
MHLSALPLRLAFVATAGALLATLAPLAVAQTIPANLNDLQLANGTDIIYIYDDPSIGPGVGTSGVPDFATNSYFWKVMSRDVLRSASGTMEVTGVSVWNHDGDYGVYEGPNNTAAPDLYISKGISTSLAIEPDPSDPNATLLTFGPGGPKNNIFLTDPSCASPPYVFAYELDVDITGGAGPGSGIDVPANGSEDLVFTVFVPGAGHTYSGPNTCMNGDGDGAAVDAHSSDAGGAIGETQFDLIGGGVASTFGGYGTLGATVGTDGVHEVAQAMLSFAEPVLVMFVDSATGQGPEEGLAGLHYDCPTTTGGTIAARLYAWQGVGRPAAVMGTLSPPLPTFLNFKGGKLGLSPTDPLFNAFLGLWQGTVIQTDNGWPATGTAYDDGTFTTSKVPLPPQAIPIGTTLPLSFQGFYKASSGALVGSQVTRFFLHG